MVRVTPSYGGGYQDEEDTTFRRYSSRGHGYPLLHDRVFPVASHDVYPGARSHHPIPRDSRAIRQSPESDSSSRPRSRIPVACGRCRKRKIKCSGDTGGPCTSCISAGNDQCQFLRVLSEPATLKQECSTYDFDPSGGAASRLNSRTGTMPFGSHAFVPQSAPLSPDGYQYRNTSLPAYPYTIRPFYAMPSYGDFGEEGVDYGLQVPLMGTEHLALTPNYITSSAAGRGWTPQMPRTPLYVEQSETPYNHNQLPFHGYPPRLNSNSEIKHGSLNGIGGSLPPPSLINGNVDRMLPPVPSSNNRTAQIGPYLRSNDGLPATTTLQTQPYPDFGMIRNSKHHNNNTISDNSSMASVSYMPMSSTSPESLSSSQMAYGSQTSMSMSQHSDIYTPPSTDGLCTNESSGAPSYGHISGASKGGSQSSHASSGDGSLPPLQNGSGPVNDREYHYAPAPNSSSYHYPMPPIHQPTPVSGRPSISVGGDQE